MTYASVVFDLVERSPEVKAHLPDHMSLDEMGGYDAFPCLIDLLKVAVEAGRGTEVAGICAFIEEVALSGKRDLDLASLVRIELGEKLGWMEHEERLAPHLGEETKRICGYVPGLATQRLESRREREVLTLGQRLLRMLRREE